MVIRIGIPNRGRLAQLCQDLINSSFNTAINISERKMLYKMGEDDIEFVLFRSTDIPQLICDNIIQMGITGNDYFLESNTNIKEVHNLFMLNGVLCIISKKNSIIRNAKDLVISTNLKCCSQYKNIGKEFVSKTNLSTTFEGIDGAAESHLILENHDYAIDVVTSGSTFIANGLKVVYPIMPVSSYLYANHDFINNDKERFMSITNMITGVDFNNTSYCEDSTRVKFNSVINTINEL
jgi:ATP phosphoribosyltransferase